MPPGHSLGDLSGNRYLYSGDGQSKRLRFGVGARSEADVRDDDSLPIGEDYPAVPVRWKGGLDVQPLRGWMVGVCFYRGDADL